MHDALSSLPGGATMAVFAVMVVIFLLGFFLDTFEIIFIVVPIAAPALLKMGVDPIWLGVMIGVNLQASFLTPPFGFALFYLRGVAGTLVRTIDIYRGVVPFVALQLVGITLLWLAPQHGDRASEAALRAGRAGECRGRAIQRAEGFLGLAGGG